jgi:hypothetical protein
MPVNATVIALESEPWLKAVDSPVKAMLVSVDGVTAPFAETIPMPVSDGVITAEREPIDSDEDNPPIVGDDPPESDISADVGVSAIDEKPNMVYQQEIMQIPMPPLPPTPAVPPVKQPPPPPPPQP